MAKLNIVNRNGSSAPECTECGKRLKIDNYHEMTAIVSGKYKCCPECGQRIVGIQVEGVDFSECNYSIRVWASGNEAGVLPYNCPWR